MKCIYAFILFLSLPACAQTLIIKELLFKPNPKRSNASVSTFIYPLIITKNTAVNKLINDKIRKEVLGSDDEKPGLSKEITHEINDGLINLSYEITFKKNGILSLHVYREDCGAHCTSAYTWLNFDLKTGRSLSINDLIHESKIDSFRNIVHNDKIKFLDKYKVEEKRLLADKAIDSATFSWAMNEVDSSCIKTATITDFSVSDGYIRIMDPCEFPLIIRSQQPDYELKYAYKDLLIFLKPAWRIRLLK